MRKFVQSAKTVYYDYSETDRTVTIYSSMQEKITAEAISEARTELDSCVKAVNDKSYQIQYVPQRFVSVLLDSHNDEVRNDQVQADILRKVKKYSVRAIAKANAEDNEKALPEDDPLDPLIMTIRTEELKERAHQMDVMLQAMACLTPARQELLKEYFLEGRLMKDMAADHNKSDRAISQNLKTALRQIKKFMEKIEKENLR